MPTNKVLSVDGGADDSEEKSQPDLTQFKIPGLDMEAILGGAQEGDYLDDYRNRSKKNDQTCKEVGMNQCKIMHLNQDSSDTNVIYTYGLTTCLGTATLLKMKDGKILTILTHYDVCSLPQLIEDFTHTIQGIDSSEIEAISMYVIEPENHSEFYGCIPTLLRLKVEELGCSDIKFTEMLYPESGFCDNKGRLRVEFGKDNRPMVICEMVIIHGEAFKDEDKIWFHKKENS